MLPVSLDVAGKPVVVVGGGPVGMRKASAALAAGAAVRVVDPAGRPPVAHAPGSVERVPEPYRPEHLDGAFLVFACATPEVNSRVVADARARGILVNSATDPAACDFTLPSVVRRGGLTLAVSTGGASPALARRIREKLETEFDAEFADWVRALGEVRVVVMAEVADPERRRELLEGFADWAWLERLRADGVDVVRAAMLAAVRAFAVETSPQREQGLS